MRDRKPMTSCDSVGLAWKEQVQHWTSTEGLRSRIQGTDQDIATQQRDVFVMIAPADSSALHPDSLIPKLQPIVVVLYAKLTVWKTLSAAHPSCRLLQVYRQLVSTHAPPVLARANKWHKNSFLSLTSFGQSFIRRVSGMGIAVSYVCM